MVEKIEICGESFSPIKLDKIKNKDGSYDSVTFYLMDGILNCHNSKYTNHIDCNGNYRRSCIREILNQSDTTKQLKEKYHDRIVYLEHPYGTDNGFYKHVRYIEKSGDVIGIPSVHLFLECKSNIPSLTELGKSGYWWTRTPVYNEYKYGHYFEVYCIDNDNNIRKARMRLEYCGIRPFFILKDNKT